MLFDQYGWYIGPELPPDCVAECTRPGCDASEPCARWRKRLNFTVPRKLAENYLYEAGAWDDLATVSDDTLAERVLWLACCHASDHNDNWYGLVH